MNGIDRWLATLLNGYAQRTLLLDDVLAFVGEEQVLKVGGLVILLCWAWFTQREDRERTRQLVIATVIGASAGSLLSRGLTHVLPYRPRPLWEPTLGLIRPPAVLPEFLEKWSSLPSDHASLLIGLSFGLWKISRRAGAIALAYSFVVGLFPRLYFGLHYLSDLVAGALVGVAAVTIVDLNQVRPYAVRPVLAWEERSPGAFYACAFFLADQIVHLFTDLRLFLRMGGEAAREILAMIRH